MLPDEPAVPAQEVGVEVDRGRLVDVRDDPVVEPGLGTRGEGGRGLGLFALEAQDGRRVGDALVGGEIMPGEDVLIFHRKPPGQDTKEEEAYHDFRTESLSAVHVEFELDDAATLDLATLRAYSENSSSVALDRSKEGEEASSCRLTRGAAGPAATELAPISSAAVRAWGR